jgi:hypothetical protein
MRGKITGPLCRRKRLEAAARERYDAGSMLIREDAAVRFIVGMMLVLITAALHAAVYKWTDEQGRVHYGDKPVHQAEPVNVPATPAAPPDAQRQLQQREAEQRQREQARQREFERQRQAEERLRQADQKAAEQRHILCERLGFKLEQYRDRRRSGCRVRECAHIDERIAYYENEWDLQCR